MGWKIVHVTSDSTVQFYLDNILVKKQNERILFPIKDVDMIFVDSYSAMLSARFLSKAAQNNILTIVCDEKHIPASINMTIEGNYKSAERFHEQMRWTDEIKAEWWKQVVQQKITNQAIVLEYMNLKPEVDILDYVRDVKMGDVTNREAHAAKVYFNSLFGNGFKRDQKDDAINFMLNYGYAILRSYFCRYIIAYGLDPRIGIFHKSIFNYFALASDLMEPFRPVIDYFIAKNRNDREFLVNYKTNIVKHFNVQVRFNGELMYLTDAIRKFMWYLEPKKKEKLPIIEVCPIE